MEHLVPLYGVPLQVRILVSAISPMYPYSDCVSPTGPGTGDTSQGDRKKFGSSFWRDLLGGFCFSSFPSFQPLKPVRCGRLRPPRCHSFHGPLALTCPSMAAPMGYFLPGLLFLHWTALAEGKFLLVLVSHGLTGMEGLCPSGVLLRYQLPACRCLWFPPAGPRRITISNVDEKEENSPLAS